MRTLLTILLLTVFSSIYAQKDKSLYIPWHDKGTDNLKMLYTDMTYCEKGKFYYYLSNDSENFYIDLRTLDKDVQRQILFPGLTVWINLEGKKTKDTGIRFPARMENQNGPGMSGMQNQPAPGNMQGIQSPQNVAPGSGGFSGGRNMQLPPASKIELIGFSEHGPTYIAPDETGNLKGTLLFENSGFMVYEIVIPFSRLPEKPQKNKGNDDSFAIAFSYQDASPGFGGSGGAPAGGQPMTSGGRGGGGFGARGAPSAGMPTGSFGSVSKSPVMIWFKNFRFSVEK